MVKPKKRWEDQEFPGCRNGWKTWGRGVFRRCQWCILASFPSCFTEVLWQEAQMSVKLAVLLSLPWSLCNFFAESSRPTEPRHPVGLQISSCAARFVFITSTARRKPRQRSKEQRGPNTEKPKRWEVDGGGMVGIAPVPCPSIFIWKCRPWMLEIVRYTHRYAMIYCF